MGRSARDSSGQIFPVFPKGGKIGRLVVGAAWTEFDPAGVDLFRVHVPAAAEGRVIYTSTANFPDLADGAAVTAEHRDVAPAYIPGTWHDGFDRTDYSDGRPPSVRFFFALDGAASAGDTVAILFEGAA